MYTTVKRILLFLLLTSSLLSFHGVVFAPASSPRQVSTFRCSLVGFDARGMGDSLSISMSCRVDDAGVARGGAVVLVPSLERGEEYVPLRPVSVYDRKSGARRGVCASGDRGEYSFVDLRSRMTFELDNVVRYHDWMDSCKLVFTFLEWRKGQSLSVLGRYEKGTVLRPEAPAFKPEFRMMEPAVSSESYRTCYIPLYLEFRPGSSKVEESLGGNAALLEDFRESVHGFLSSRKTSIRSVTVAGWTSAEGPQKENAALSRRRAQSVASYLSRKGAFAGYSPSVTGRGEDWGSLLSWVSETLYADDPDVKADFLDVEDPDEAEARAKARLPRFWSTLDSLYFPLMDRIDCEITFRAPSFKTPGDALSAYLAEPRILSAHDYWFMFPELVEGSDGWLDAVLSCVEYYPWDGAANLNAAQALLMTGHPSSASFFLSRAPEGPDTDYVAALWKMDCGQVGDALSLLAPVRSRSSRAARAWEYVSYISELQSNRNVRYIFIPGSE